MSLQLNFNICQSSDCSELVFTETTGLYNALTNLTGWGSPNPLINNAISATLIVELSSGNSYSINLLTTTLFPSSDNEISYTIDNSSIGYIPGSSIDDQIIRFTYNVTISIDGVETKYSQTLQFPFFCQVKCCVLSMFKSIDFDCDSCVNKKTNAINAFVMLQGLMANANCGNKSNFNNILSQLQKLCKNSNCSNCK